MSADIYKMLPVEVTILDNGGSSEPLGLNFTANGIHTLPNINQTGSFSVKYCNYFAPLNVGDAIRIRIKFIKNVTEGKAIFYVGTESSAHTINAPIAKGSEFEFRVETTKINSSGSRNYCKSIIDSGGNVLKSISSHSTSIKGTDVKYVDDMFELSGYTAD